MTHDGKELIAVEPRRCPIYKCNARGTVQVPGHSIDWLLCDRHANAYALRHRDETRELHEWITARLALQVEAS